MLKSTQAANPTDPPCAVEKELHALFEAEESKLLRFAFSLVGRRVVAEEIVQEVFLQLYLNWDSVDAPRAWLARSVRNRALNHLRKTRREFWLSDSPSPTDADGQGEPPDAMLEKLEMVAAMRGLISELPEVDRQLIELRYFNGLKYREIGTRVGMTVSNVGFRLHCVVKQLALRMRSRGVVGD